MLNASIAQMKTDGCIFKVVIDTSEIAGVPGGLTVGPTETVFLHVGEKHPAVPPDTYVEPDGRLLGYPHVIQGMQLCTYLDPGREWNPTYGLEQALERTREWFDNAANDRFDPRTSLFHAVGGAPPTTIAVPIVVMRTAPPPLKAISICTLTPRPPARLDVSRWRSAPAVPGEVPAVVLKVPSPLSLGLGRTVAELATQIGHAGGAEPAQTIAAVLRGAERSKPGSPIHLGLVVAHPTEPDLPAVVFGMVMPPFSDKLRRRDVGLTPANTPIEWMPMSDERPDVTTPRDARRPASALEGKVVEIWGCGGLGSWIAEFVVRARPKRVTLRDGGQVHGGHLVRQNYLEADLGLPKAMALKSRLEALSDSAEILVGSPSAEDAMSEGELPECDLIIDATINETVKHRLDAVAPATSRPPLLVEVSLDRASGTLGLVIVAAPGSGVAPATVDRRLESTALGSSELEDFHDFWRPPPVGTELLPAPGCSTPTYHGSAADLAVVAGTMVNIIGQQLSSPVTGIHLFASPHSGRTPPYRFIPDG
ncbi:MAG: Thiamine biosynthesis protein ThiF [Actinomycetia bacterium]|nr:Thiamine biosynthesis protein ThiF [Actinomycetes bacterium]